MSLGGLIIYRRVGHVFRRVGHVFRRVDVSWEG